MSDYEHSYTGRIRNLVGKQKIIMTAARAVIRDLEERLLLVRRRDNGLWAMPAGGQELDESIANCVTREVREETGLTVISAIPMAIYSAVSAVTAYGDPYHLFVTQFLVEEWSGELARETNETTDAGFFSVGSLPDEIAPFYGEILCDIQTYDGNLILK